MNGFRSKLLTSAVYDIDEALAVAAVNETERREDDNATSLEIAEIRAETEQAAIAASVEIATAQAAAAVDIAEAEAEDGIDEQWLTSKFAAQDAQLAEIRQAQLMTATAVEKLAELLSTQTPPLVTAVETPPIVETIPEPVPANAVQTPDNPAAPVVKTRVRRWM